MSTFRSVLTMSVHVGQEAAYLKWLEACPSILAPVYSRAGVREKVVLMSGRQLIVHYETEQIDSVQRAFADPVSVAEMQGPLSGLLDPAVAPGSYTGELAWQSDSPLANTYCALKMGVNSGMESPYLKWVQDGAVTQFDGVWRRAGLARKEVLISGQDVIAYYKCIDVASVLATFGEPEAIEAMNTNLGPMLRFDPVEPMRVYEQQFVWSAA